MRDRHGVVVAGRGPAGLQRYDLSVRDLLTLSPFESRDLRKLPGLARQLLA